MHGRYPMLYRLTGISRRRGGRAERHERGRKRWWSELATIRYAQVVAVVLGQRLLPRTREGLGHFSLSRLAPRLSIGIHAVDILVWFDWLIDGLLCWLVE